MTQGLATSSDVNAERLPPRPEDTGLVDRPNRWQGRVYTSTARVLILATTLLAWQVVGAYTSWGAWVSTPSDVWGQLVVWHHTGVLWAGLRATMTATLLGFVIGATVGGVLGLVLGSMRRLGLILEPFVLALYSIPKIALAPLFVLWFGIDLLPKVMMAAILVGFLVFFSVYQGFRTIDERLIDITRLMGGGRLDVLRKVAMPYSAAWMFSGLKMGLPYALIGAVVGEFMAATVGLGYLVKNASSQFNTKGVFAGLVVLMVVSSVLFAVLATAEKRVLHWAGKGV